MAQDYTFLGLVSLEPGSWADWFSGTMSALAVATALAAYPIANWQKRRQDRQRDAEIGRGVGWKTLTLLNHNADIDRHIKSSLASPHSTYPPNMKFPLVRPLGVPDRKPQELSQAEMDFLLKSQSSDLLMELELCFGRYASIVFAMNEYKVRHDALYELMPSPVSNQDMTFSHQLTPAEAARIRPYTLMLESLLDSIISLIDENANRLSYCIKEYNDSMTRYFGQTLMNVEIDPTQLP